MALKTDKPVEFYMETLENLKSAETAESIDSLPQEQQDWLRKQ